MSSSDQIMAGGAQDSSGGPPSKLDFSPMVQSAYRLNETNRDDKSVKGVGVLNYSTDVNNFSKIDEVKTGGGKMSSSSNPALH